MKKYIALILAAAMCLCLLAACAKKTDTAQDPEQDTQQDTQTPVETPENTEGEEPDENADENTDEKTEAPDPEEIVEINVWLWAMGTVKADYQQPVEDAINAITEPSIGVHCNIDFIEFGDYGTQLTIAIAGGEQVDVACTYPFGGCMYSTLLSNSQMTDIAPYLEEYGPDILELAGPYLTATSVGEHVYGVPTLRAKASAAYIEYVVDVANELGIKEQVDSMETWEDLEAVMEVAKNNTDLYSFADNGRVTSVSNAIYDTEKISVYSADSVGDNLHLLYIDPETHQVSRIYENPGYTFMMEKSKQWYDAGYVYPDTYVSENAAAVMMKSDISWMNICSSEFGVEGSISNEVGKDIDVIKIGDGTLMTQSFIGWCNFVPITAQEPEAAVAFLNELYKNADLMNTIFYGIEGETYTLNEDGTVTTGDQYLLVEFEIGNSFLAYPVAGNGADYREQAKQDLENSITSVALGFSLNTEPLSTTIAGLTAVDDEFYFPLLGGLYTETLYEEYCAALEAADIDSYQAAVQEQLDAWFAENS